MQQYARFITLIGGILAFFCFALPWESNYSGIYLANGEELFITIAFIGSLTIFATGSYLLNRRPRDNSSRISLAILMICLGLLFSTGTFIQLLERGINFITISFIASLVIIGTTIYMLNQQTPWTSFSTLWVLISSCVGLICLFVLFFGRSLDIEINDIEIKKIRYGAFLTATGYILALVGLLCFPETKRNAKSSEGQGKEADPEGDEE